jgi:lauroyl/myristoyl acyltransferase
MNLQSFLNSQIALSVAQNLGRVVSPRLGYRVSDLISHWIAAQRKSRMVQAVRCNQWVVSGGRLSSDELDRRTLEVFRCTGRCLIDLYQNIQNPTAMDQLFFQTAEFDQFVERVKARTTGMLLVCPHISNFDLVGRVLAFHGIHMQVLSVPQPTSGYQEQNQLRQMAGIEMTPLSLSAIRRADENLRTGGVVLTGVDRPADGSRYHPKFFGRTAELPEVHIRLALKYGVQITAISSQTRPDGKYQLLVSDPITMKPYTNPIEEIERNAEAVLKPIENWICQTPEQWSMFYPVWPDVNLQK